MSLQLWLAFLGANFAISVSPGPGALAVVNNSLAGGVRTAWRVVAGLQLALLTHLVIVAVGLGALLVASPAAFGVLRWAGAAYLAWLGLGQLIDAFRSPHDVVAGQSPREAPFMHGLLVNLTNPKSIVFSLAFIPQFVDYDQPLLLQYFIIGVTMVILDSFVMGGYALLAARLRPLLGDAFWGRVRRIFFGMVFMGLGLRLLFAP